MAAKQSNSLITLKEPLLRYLKKPGQSFVRVYMISLERFLCSSSLRLYAGFVKKLFSDIEKGICGYQWKPTVQTLPQSILRLHS